jgi:CDP-glycerol glycerophosphotransferase (TagB/SpsB family)
MIRPNPKAPMSKPRVAIPVVIQFSIRYMCRSGLLHRMLDYAQPVFFLGWENRSLQQELEAAGAEVLPLPKAKLDKAYTRIKRQIDILHLMQIASPSTSIDRRRVNLLVPPSFRSRIRDSIYSLNLKFPWQPDRLYQKERTALHSSTNITEFQHLLTQHRIDAVFNLTPFYSQEQLLIRAAKNHHIPLCTSILSFDNLTTRGWIPVISDTYLLWNSCNKQELFRGYPKAEDKNVAIVGAPQFDFYWDSSYVMDESTWRKMLGLPPDRPVILFGAGHYMVAYHEPDILKHIDEAVEQGQIPHQPIILFRQHPNDPIDRWQSILKQCKHVVYDAPWDNADKGIAHTNIQHRDIEKLASTLAHSQVHVNTSSTMTIDGAIFDRPQIGPAYDEAGPEYNRVMRDLYEREHFLPITHSGGLAIAYSRQELIAAIGEALEQPQARCEARRKMIREIITFDDGKATQRVSAELQTFLDTY